MADRPVGAAAPPKVPADLPRVRRRHWGRWVGGALAVAALALVGRAFATGDIEWQIVGSYLTGSAILQGLFYTVVITAASMALGIVLGTLVAVMRLTDNPVLQSIAAGYVWFFRGVPVLLQLLLWYNLALVFPTIWLPGLGSQPMINVMTPFLASLLGLGLHQSAYTAEIVRAGILGVDTGQVEAAQSLSMGSSHILRRIVLPQAMRTIIPPMGNEVISTLKTSSLAAVVTFGELLQSAQLIYYANNRVIELLIVVTCWYLVLVSLLSIGQYFLERRFGRGFRTTSRAQTTGSEA